MPNLDYFQARYYSGEQGRFLSPDPANAGADLYNPQSWNGYSYALNSPLTYTDPDGLASITDPCAGNPNCVNVTAQYPGLSPSDEMLYRSLVFDQIYRFSLTHTEPNPPPPPQRQQPPKPAKNDPCANAALSAAGVNIRQRIAVTNRLINVGFAINGGTNGNPIAATSGALYGFYSLVQTGGPYDDKNQPGPGTYQQRVDAGNISYGVTCPFGAIFCQAAAGAAQAGPGVLNWITKGRLGHGAPGPIRTFFDSPDDNASIKVGQAMRAAGCNE